MLKQLKIIKILKEILNRSVHIETAIIYGSIARQTPSVNSDIDIAIIVKKSFDENHLLEEFKSSLAGQLSLFLKVDLRNKLVLYFNDLPKAEIAYFQNISDITRNFLGSEIPYELIHESILFDKSNKAINFLKLISETESKACQIDRTKSLLNLVNKFIYEFESCSNAHRRSDGYQFYFFYNIALNCVVQIRHLLFSDTRFNFLPKYFIPALHDKEEMESIYKLNGSLFLPEANSKKRELLNYFYKVIEKHDRELLNQFKPFLESVFVRDFFWNFRDLATHNSKIKKGVIYRTATLSVFQDNKAFYSLLNEKQIKTIIDLRSEREIAEKPYTPEMLAKINYVKASFDPWNQPEWFKQNHHIGTNEEIAYRFFALACKDEIKKGLNAILDETNGSVAIHCFAGKDRTGIFASLLHLVSEADETTINTDYLASEVDVKLNRLNIVMEIIKEHGGIRPYLKSCGLEINEIEKLKAKLLNG